MKIPKTLKIGGHIYKIIIRNKRIKDADTRLGSVDVYANHIFINRDGIQAQSQQESTLLHEIIEAISELNKLKFAEEQICILETGLYQVLKDNKLI